MIDVKAPNTLDLSLTDNQLEFAACINELEVYFQKFMSGDFLYHDYEVFGTLRRRLLELIGHIADDYVSENFVAHKPLNEGRFELRKSGDYDSLRSCFVRVIKAHIFEYDARECKPEDFFEPYLDEIATKYKTGQKIEGWINTYKY